MQDSESDVEKANFRQVLEGEDPRISCTTQLCSMTGAYEIPNTKYQCQYEN